MHSERYEPLPEPSAAQWDRDADNGDRAVDAYLQAKADDTADKKKLQSALMYCVAYLECCQLSGKEKHNRAIDELRTVLKATGVAA